MKVIDFGEIVRGLDDSPMLDGVHPVSLGKFAVQALLSITSGGLENKLKHYRLAMRIYHSTGPIEVSDEEVLMLKNVIGNAYNVLVVGRTMEIIDSAKEIN